jgi:glycosyltransferase involved in cell wall biosynthesis
MDNNKYIIKNLAPWMINELLAFSQISTFEIVFLRKQSDFYKEGIGQLADNGIKIYYRPQSIHNLPRKLYISALFVLRNLKNFGFDYNSVIGLKSLIWYIKLDMSLFSAQSQLHSQFATQATIVSLLIKQYYNNQPEYSFTFHAYDIYFKNKWFNLLMENCKNAFSISDYNIKYVKRNYAASDKMKLSRLGVFRDSIHGGLARKPQTKLFMVGLVSWFVEKKGIHYLLQAFLRLKEQGHSDIRLILAGDGPLKEQYLEFINSNHLTESIKYIGKIKGEEKNIFFNSLDAFVLPSITMKNDQDGIPVVLMEAIAYGLPIISSQVSGIPEICINNYNGRLINEKNVNNIIEAIAFLHKKKAVRINYSRNSLLLSRKYDIVINSQNKVKELGWLKDSE